MGLLNKAIIALLLVYPLTELGRISLTNGIVFNIRDGFVFFVLLFWIGVLIRKKELPNKALVQPFVIFIGVCVLSLLVNISTFGMHTVLSSGLYIIRWASYAVLIFAVSYLSKEQKQKLQYVLLFDGIALLVAGFIQYAFYQNLVNLYYLGWDDHMYRMFSTFLDPNFAGIFFAFFSLYVLSFAMRERTRNTRFFYALIGIYGISMIALLLTFSRSGMVVYVIATIVYFAFSRYKKVLALLLILFICGVALVSNTGVTSRDPFRLDSSRARLDSLSAAATIAKDHPIIGIGFNNYRYALHAYGYRNWPAALWETSHADASTDNSLLFIAATTGIIGLSVYLYLWYVLVKRVVLVYKKQHSQEASMVVATIVGLFVASLFINALFYPPFMLWIWILLGIIENKRP